MRGGGRSDPGLMKRLIEAVSMKTSQLRNRIMVFVLLHRDESLLMDGMHAVLGGPRHRHRHLMSAVDDDVDDRENLIGEGADNFIMYMNRESATVTQPSSPPHHQVFAYTQEDSEGRNFNHKDLTHNLLKDSEDEMELTDNELDNLDISACRDIRGSLASMNNTTEVEDDDIDHAADVFIARFKRQMR